MRKQKSDVVINVRDFSLKIIIFKMIPMIIVEA